MSENYLPHVFSPQVAELYGVNAALIFRYLSHVTSTGRWTSPTLAELSARYPYMGDWQVWAALKKLTNPGRKTPPLVLRKFVNGSYLYKVIAPDTCLSPHTFDVNIAVKVGVIPAVMYHNLGHWIRMNWKQRAEALYTTVDPDEFDYDEYQIQRHVYQMTRGAAAHYTSAAEWVKEHPYVKLSNAKSSFMLLQKEGLILRGPRRRHRRLWLLTRKTLNQYEQEMLNRSNLGSDSSKTQNQRQKPKAKAKNPKLSPETQCKPGLSDSPEDTSDAFIEARIKEAAAFRLKKQIIDNSNAFRSSSALADASSPEAGTASTAGATPSAIRARVSRWNTANLPPVRKQKKDALGRIQKQVRRKIPLPDDPEYYAYLDSLSLEERLSLSS